MNCNKANQLMMKYMDGCLLPEEAMRLNEHLQTCENCKEEFFAYQMIIEGFDTLETVEAPKGFEAQVMQKIDGMDIVFASKTASMDNVLGMIWGIFSFLFGIGMLLTIYREPILQELIKNPYIGEWIAGAIPLVDIFSEYMANLQQAAVTLSASVQDFISSSKVVIATILAVLGGIQYFLYHKDKVEA